LITQQHDVSRTPRDAVTSGAPPSIVQKHYRRGGLFCLAAPLFALPVPPVKLSTVGSPSFPGCQPIDLERPAAGSDVCRVAGYISPTKENTYLHEIISGLCPGQWTLTNMTSQT